MNITLSPSAGLCILGDPDALVVCAVPNVHLSITWDAHSLSTLADWEVRDYPDASKAIEECGNAFWLNRAISLARECFGQLTESLLSEVLHDVEEILQTRVSPGSLLSHLLVAPLLLIEPAQHAAALALAQGLGAIANVLDRVADLQPLLRRLTINWLRLPDSEFAEVITNRFELWQRLIFSERIVALLEAPNRGKFLAIWNEMAFEEQLPPRRSAIGRIGRIFAEQQFDGPELRVVQVADREDEQRAERHLKKRSGAERFAAGDRAKKQIAAIADAVAQGDESNAQKFLQDLVLAQTETSEDHQYAVKSLCNIAKQSADMYRTDIERQCLDAALQIDANDPWTLIQMGDHLKRVGQYAAAVEVLGRALYAEPEVAASSIADVYAQQGQYQRAIEAYKSIPTANTSPIIKTALADNLRRQGEFDQAKSAYDALVLEGLGTHRVFAGLAEIARRRGDLSEAVELYAGVIRDPGIEKHSRNVYRLALAAILKQMGRLRDSFALTDVVIKESSFSMHARLLRASILALMDKDEAGLEEMLGPERPHAFGEWMRSYYRGLLLLKLKRFDKARSQLVDNLDSAYISSEERAILRLAAALSFLMEDDFTQAAGLLVSVPRIQSRYAEYLATVLRFHVAVARDDTRTAEDLLRQLERNRPDDPEVWRAVSLLKLRDFKNARVLELRAFLRLAA